MRRNEKTAGAANASRRTVLKAMAWSTPVIAAAAAAPLAAASTVIPTYKVPFDSRVFNTLLWSDPALVPATFGYVGIVSHQMYVRNVGSPGGTRVMKDTYMFTATWPDGHVTKFYVDTAVGDLTAARAQFATFRNALSRIPVSLRSLIDEVNVLQSDTGFSGGGGAINATTGGYDDLDYLLGTLVHEAAHTLGQNIYADPVLLARWKAAQDADRGADKQYDGFISVNGYNNPDREDISGAILAWISLKFHPERLTPEQRALIEFQIPARMQFFESLGLDLRPLSS